MVVTQHKSKKSVTGARYKDYRKKKLYEKGSEATLTKIDKRKVLRIRGKGGNIKARLITSDIANVFDAKTKKYEKVKVKSVIENPASSHFIRRNIITKGAIIETEKGKAKVTSRPGQDGAINAVLIS
ncbi:MAG: 30S ribosomal protein S8e [Nanoarchaeota archaeon]|nr:30S ribosomal protein S8e [Nanoarchaeota archaeon]